MRYGLFLENKLLKSNIVFIFLQENNRYGDVTFNGIEKNAII